MSRTIAIRFYMLFLLGQCVRVMDNTAFLRGKFHAEMIYLIKMLLSSSSNMFVKVERAFVL